MLLYLRQAYDGVGMTLNQPLFSPSLHFTRWKNLTDTTHVRFWFDLIFVFLKSSLKKDAGGIQAAGEWRKIHLLKCKFKVF